MCQLRATRAGTAASAAAAESGVAASRHAGRVKKRRRYSVTDDDGVRSSDGALVAITQSPLGVTATGSGDSAGTASIAHRSSALARKQRRRRRLHRHLVAPAATPAPAQAQAQAPTLAPTPAPARASTTPTAAAEHGREGSAHVDDGMPAHTNGRASGMDGYSTDGRSVNGGHDADDEQDDDAASVSTAATAATILSLSGALGGGAAMRGREAPAAGTKHGNSANSGNADDGAGRHHASAPALSTSAPAGGSVQQRTSAAADAADADAAAASARPAPEGVAGAAGGSDKPAAGSAPASGRPVIDTRAHSQQQQRSVRFVDRGDDIHDGSSRAGGGQTTPRSILRARRAGGGSGSGRGRGAVGWDSDDAESVRPPLSVSLSMMGDTDLDIGSEFAMEGGDDTVLFVYVVARAEAVPHLPQHWATTTLTQQHCLHRAHTHTHQSGHQPSVRHRRWRRWWPWWRRCTQRDGRHE